MDDGSVPVPLISTEHSLRTQCLNESRPRRRDPEVSAERSIQVSVRGDFLDKFERGSAASRRHLYASLKEDEDGPASLVLSASAEPASHRSSSKAHGLAEDYRVHDNLPASVFLIRQHTQSRHNNSYFIVSRQYLDHKLSP